MSAILAVLLEGYLESLDDKKSLSYFDAFLNMAGIMSIHRQIKKKKISGLVNMMIMKRIQLLICFNFYEVNRCIILLDSYTSSFELDYGSGCDRVNCNRLGDRIRNWPNFMYLYVYRCGNGHLHLLIGFSNTSYDELGYNKKEVFDPNYVLIGEGARDKKHILNIVAC